MGLCGAEKLSGEEFARIDPEISVIRRGDSLPVDNFESAMDSYLRGGISKY